MENEKQINKIDSLREFIFGDVEKTAELKEFLIDEGYSKEEISLELEEDLNNSILGKIKTESLGHYYAIYHNGTQTELEGLSKELYYVHHILELIKLTRNYGLRIEDIIIDVVALRLKLDEKLMLMELNL